MGAMKVITQEAFDEAVKSNIEDFEMEAAEAVQSAIEEFEIQKADLTGVSKTFYGDRKEHPVIALTEKLQSEVAAKDASGLISSLAELTEILTNKDNGEDHIAEALAVTGQKGMVPSLLEGLDVLEGNQEGTVACLKAAAAVLNTDPHREAFHQQGGTKRMLRVLGGASKGELVAAALLTTAQSCFKNEDNKASFVAGGGDDAILAVLRDPEADSAALVAACTALRSVTVADDERPCLTSGAFKTAREICVKGAAGDLLNVLRGAQTGAAPLAAAACSALRRVSVTDEICQDIANQDGIELLLSVIREYNSAPAVTRTSMSVLRQLANSDSNKNLIIQRGGIPALQAVCKNLIPGSSEQALGLIVGLTLRNPDGAVVAVEAGCVDTIVEVMAALPGEQWVQRQGCMALRNVVSRNPEHKQECIDKGAEKLLRSAQAMHPQACKDVGGAALRDLGFEDYDLGLDEESGGAWLGPRDE